MAMLLNATAPHAHAGLTPLRFLHADPEGRRGRRLSATPRGRGLSPHGLGMQLHGNLHTLGYFSLLSHVCQRRGRC